MKSLLMLLGRVALSLVFLGAAVEKILNWESAHQNLMDGLCSWYTATLNFPKAQEWFELLIPNTHFLLILGLVFEGLGGLLVLLGFRPRFGASLLLLFIIPATMLMHAFWMVPPAEKELQMIMFFKNVSIIGGLLLLIASGSGEKAAKSSNDD